MPRRRKDTEPMTATLLDDQPGAGTALAVRQEYAVLRLDPEALSEVLVENLGTTGRGASDLDRIRVPAGGGTRWQVPTASGTEDPQELVGIIAAWQDRKVYWREQIEDGGGGNPPDCHSEDLVMGIGDPGVPCKTCEFNQFGSAVKGEGKACKDIRLLFIVRPGDFLPLIVSVPPSSLANVRRYFTRLAGQGLPYYGVVSSLRLGQTKNNTGIAYSEILPAAVGPVDPESLGRIKVYAQAIRATFASVEVEAGDLGGGARSGREKTAAEHFAE
jgi:hypothetical protein